jgi:alginate O-acetyltransferase complex protein AlgI
MLLGGLWHGAAWNYVLWGAYQGVLLASHRLFTRDRESSVRSAGAANITGDAAAATIHTRSLPDWISTPLRIAVFFSFCCYGWLLFRAHSFEQIKTFTLLLFGFGPEGTSVIAKPTTSALLGIVLLIFLQLCDYRTGSLESYKRWRPPAQGLLYATLIFVLIMGTSNAPVQFIYFQF